MRPTLSGDAKGGDSVVYRRVEAFLRARCDLTVLEMAPAGRLQQLLGMVSGAALEPARYTTAGNQIVLDEAVASGRFPVVIYGHEAVFDLGLKAPRGPRRVFYAHNVQSGVSAGGDALIDRLIAPATVRFDRAWTADPRDHLVCISRHDIAALRRIGVSRDDILLVPPGPPPPAPLAAGAGVIAEVVLTGSYGWWRKRRDVKRFAEGAPLPYPILVSDPVAVALLGDQAVEADAAGIDWSAGLRPALVTDRFLGGFKLKALEYVALNCAVFSFCDLRGEFEGLPHADEFVRVIGSKAELSMALAEFLTRPSGPLVERFRVFKAACLQRFDWQRSLAPLGKALEAPAD